MMTIANEHFNCIKMVSCKVTTIKTSRCGGVGGHHGDDRGVGGVRV